jgi:ferredoxin
MRCYLLLLAVCSVLSGCNGFGSLSDTSFALRRPAGTALSMTVLSYNGKKKDFPPGSSLEKAIAQLGVKVKYSCKKGDCATCQITLAGRYTKPCVAKVPPAPTLKSLQEKGLEIRV